MRRAIGYKEGKQDSWTGRWTGRWKTEIGFTRNLAQTTDTICYKLIYVIKQDGIFVQNKKKREM